MANKHHRTVMMLAALVGVLVLSLFASACYPNLVVVQSPSPSVQASPESSPISPISNNSNPEKGTRAWLSASNNSVNVGDSLEVGVVINTGNVGISGGDIIVSFNPDTFQATDIKVGSLLGPNTVLGKKTN